MAGKGIERAGYPSSGFDKDSERTSYPQKGFESDPLGRDGGGFK